MKYEPGEITIMNNRSNNVNNLKGSVWNKISDLVYVLYLLLQITMSGRGPKISEHDKNVLRNIILHEDDGRKVQ